jgi:hypothetical protein
MPPESLGFGDIAKVSRATRHVKLKKIDRFVKVFFKTLSFYDATGMQMTVFLMPGLWFPESRSLKHRIHTPRSGVYCGDRRKRPSIRF